MKFTVRLLVVLGVVIPLLSSCALMWRHRELAPGEMRLIKIELPEVMAENLPYDVMIRYAADGEPDVEKACFRWIADTPSVAKPSLYWYTHEVQSDQPIGSARARWLAEGPYMDISGTFCLDAGAIRDAGESLLIVKFKAGDLKPEYNRLECYVEYRSNGEQRRTNEVSAKFTMEK